MIFIESSRFTELVTQHLSDDEYSALQWLLYRHPDFGDVVPGSGGVRKIRWGKDGRGKRGGVRILYVWKVSESEIWLLTMHAKNERSQIPPQVLRQIAEELVDD